MLHPERPTPTKARPPVWLRDRGSHHLGCIVGQGSDVWRLNARQLTLGCYWSSREIVTLLSSTRVRCHIRRRTSHS
jgi:hypothetical protein